MLQVHQPLLVGGQHGTVGTCCKCTSPFWLVGSMALRAHAASAPAHLDGWAAWHCRCMPQVCQPTLVGGQHGTVGAPCLAGWLVQLWACSSCQWQFCRCWQCCGLGLPWGAWPWAAWWLALGCLVLGGLVVCLGVPGWATGLGAAFVVGPGLALTLGWQWCQAPCCVGARPRGGTCCPGNQALGWLWLGNSSCQPRC